MPHRAILSFAAATALLVPFLVLAQSDAKVNAIVNQVTGTLRLVIGLLIVLATVVFIYGLVKFITAAENVEERKKGRGLMIWGIIALAVMAAAWGVVTVIMVYFGIDEAPRVIWPTVQFRSQPFNVPALQLPTPTRERTPTGPPPLRTEPREGDRVQIICEPPNCPN